MELQEVMNFQLSMEQIAFLLASVASWLFTSVFICALIWNFLAIIPALAKRILRREYDLDEIEYTLNDIKIDIEKIRKSY